MNQTSGSVALLILKMEQTCQEETAKPLKDLFSVMHSHPHQTDASKSLISVKTVKTK
jgi:hypothetical protein